MRKNYSILHITIAVLVGLLLTLSNFLLSIHLLFIYFIAKLIKTISIITIAVFIFYETTESDSIESKIFDIFVTFFFPLLISYAVFNFFFSIIEKMFILV